MADEVERKIVNFTSNTNIVVDTDYYRARDGWSIELINGTLTFCATDPGLSAKDIRIPLSCDDLEYAKNNNPSFNDMGAYMHSKGLM